MTQMRPLLNIKSLAELTSVQQPPCRSLYQPTHRCHPENQQDPIRFGNLVKELEASLQQKYPDAETRLLLGPFQSLAHHHDFWTHTLDGLAVLGGTGLFQVFQLQRPVAELAVVADSFHTKPLRRFLQSAGRYQVLGLSLHKINDHITRLEVHLSDEDSHKSGQEGKRCMIEARLEGRQPIAVAHQAVTLDQAVDGAAGKLARLIESTLGRLRDQKSPGTDEPESEPKLTEHS